MFQAVALFMFIVTASSDDRRSAVKPEQT